MTNLEIVFLAKDKFAALADFYTPFLNVHGKPNIHRYTNADDAFGQINQDEMIAMCRVLRTELPENDMLAGKLLRGALMRVCLRDAQDEADDERGEGLP